MKSPRILLLNGIESAGVNSVDQVGIALTEKGYHVVDVNLKVVRWFRGRYNTTWQENIKRVLAAAQEGDHVVAHSNGCRICYDMMDGGFHFGNLFWFAPALDRKLALRDCCYRHCDVFANPKDKVLLFGSLKPNHPWGAMGKKGYKGPCLAKVRTLFYPNGKGLGHSHYFKPPLLKQLVNVIDQELTTGGPQGGA